MGTFAYVARDSSGQQVTGRLAGASEQAVLNELYARQLAPVRVRPLRERRQWRQGVSGRQLATFYRQLADLLRAGVPLLRALRLLGRGRSNARLAKVVNDVADQVADGARMADAMARHEQVFPSVQIAMIRAGERGGFLEPVLGRMGRFLEHQADMRSKVLGSLLYPALLLGLCLLVVIGALAFFVPQFEDFYAKMDVPLPTTIVLGLSDIVTDWWHVALVVLIALGFGVRWLLGRAEVKRRLAAWQLKVPKLGPLRRDIVTARVARLLGTLLDNGVPLLAAMQISRDAAGHVLMAEAIDEATESVRGGESLAQPLAASGLFSDDVIEMISVGEAANNLAEVLITVADTIDTRVERMLTVVIRLLEPLLLMFLGGVVMFLFLALVIPMMRLSSAL